jgi:hypothetical protein
VPRRLIVKVDRDEAICTGGRHQVQQQLWRDGLARLKLPVLQQLLLSMLMVY